MHSLDAKLGSLVAAERLEIAFRIAESGLILMGTSWLSNLSSLSIKRVKVYKKPPKYLININDGDQSLGPLLDRITPLRGTLHSYIFIIGAILVELALNHRVRDVKWTQQGLWLVAPRSGSLLPYSVNHVVNLVEKAMEKPYSEAVKFCLQDPNVASNVEWESGVLYDDTYSEEERSIRLLDLFSSRFWSSKHCGIDLRYFR